MEVGCSLKHFALNNQEYKRFSSNSMVDERTMREIYLSGFEKAIQKGEPSTVMCSYNKINGVHASDHKELLTDILRKEYNLMMPSATDCSLRSMKINAGMNNGIFEGLLELANGHFIKGILKMIKG